LLLVVVRAAELMAVVAVRVVYYKVLNLYLMVRRCWLLLVLAELVLVVQVMLEAHLYLVAFQPLVVEVEVQVQAMVLLLEALAAVVVSPYFLPLKV
jgi:hypothetical protein